MLRFGRRKIVAIWAGALLLGACFLVLAASLDRIARGLARSDLASMAESKLVLAENRIGHVLGSLDALANRGVASCNMGDLELMQQAVFSNVMIKEISLVAPDGQVLCATSGLMQTAQPVSTARTSAAQSIAIEIFRFRDTNEKILRLRRVSENSPRLAAVLLASSLIAQNSTETNRIPSYGRLDMPDGTLIVESGAVAVVQGEIALSASLASPIYGLNLRLSLPQSVQRAHKARILTVGLAMVAGIGLLLLIFWVVVPGRRPRDNPIAELERALDAGEFVPYYQPIVDLVTGKLRGAEVLIRWRKPDGTTVSPAAFIPLAESSGIILEMTRVLMRRVCEEMGPAFNDRPHLKVSFNLAARHFQDESIVQDVRDIFGRRGAVRLSQVVLEVTERQPIDNLVETRRLIAALQGLGVRMAIDDVGTGHSGLSYILKLGVDIIKIDKMFVDAIGIERSSTTIIETLIDLAHNMRMDIVAEGVETFEQVVALRERGIRAAQGFVFAPPLPGKSFLQLVEAIEPITPAAETGTPSRAVG